MAKLLFVVGKQGFHLEIECDQDGVKYLSEALLELEKGDHEHIFGAEAGGDEMSGGEDDDRHAVVPMVTIRKV